jgi:diguanylate cyclase (GGDEF)-like protein/PAS domain S-box-containing protein
MQAALARVYSHSVTAWLVLAAGLVVSAAGAWLTARQLDGEARLRFEAAASDARSAIGSRVNDYADVLRGARALFLAETQITRDEFRRYIQNLDLDSRYPGIQVIHYSERLSHAQRPAFEAAMRADTSVDPRGYPDFYIRPRGERAEYVVAKYVEPMKGNERAFGLDLGGDPVRLAALNRTRDSGRLTASGTIALADDPKRHPGFAMRLAVYRRDAPIATVAQRREAFTGMVSASFVVIDLMRGVLPAPILQQAHVRIHDAGFLDSPKGLEAPTAQNLIFDSNRLSGGEPMAAPATEGLRVLSDLEIGGRRWNLYFTAKDLPGTAIDRGLPWAVLLAGALVSVLLFSLIRSLASTGTKAIELAERITGDLRRSEEALRATNEQLQTLVQSSPLAIYTRDRDGMLTSWNPAAERMYGWSAAEVLGKPLPSVPGEARGASDALRMRLLAGEKFIKYEGRRLRRDGTPIEIDAFLGQLLDSAGNVSGIIAAVADVTERKQVEARQAMEHKVTRLIAEHESLEKVMPEVIRTICESLGLACGARRIWDPAEQKIACAETWSIPVPEVEAFMEASREPRSLPGTSGGLIRRTLATGEPTWIADVTQDPSFRRGPLAVQAGLRGAFAFPIRFGNETLGVMEFFSRASRQPDEVLLQSTRSIGSQIGQYMARKQAEERVLHLAHYDGLTGLPNRTLFHQRVGHALARARRTGLRLAILFIDLDRFKNINDTLGHDAGDRVLNVISGRLRKCLREVDTIGRLGGDEFVVLLEDLPDLEQVAAVARKILAEIGEPIALTEQEVHISGSIGISTFPDDSEDMQGLMKNADISMYRAKEQGKDNYQFYSAMMNEHTLERLALENALRRAIERDEFLLHYQPKLNIGSGVVCGMEALVRWQRPGKGLVPPAQFIPLAEETGLIVPIGKWVLRTACARNKAWQDAGLPPLRIAVNLSARQFAQETLVEDVAEVLRETGLDPALLELEITESMVMRNPEHAVALLDRLKAMGVHLSIDDFGTGYSSLSYLKRFPIDAVKIDRSFIQDLPADGDDAAITQAILAMAHSLRLEVIAEGVETAAQLRFLREHGCDEMQGYHFSKPLAEEEFLLLMQQPRQAAAG